MKSNKPINILIIEDNPGDYLLAYEFLRLSRLPVNKYFHSPTIGGINAALDGNVPDVILLDLSLPDSSGEESVTVMVEMFPKTPIIVFSGYSDMALSLRAINLGAQDYIIKGEFDENILAKTIQYSIERKQVLEILNQYNERFKILIRATNDIVWDCDLVNNTVDRGAGITELLGYRNSEIGNSFDWFYGKMLPKDSKRVQEKMEDCIRNKIEYWNDEFRLMASDGSIKSVLGRGCIMYDTDKNPYRMIFSITDLTKIKKLEAKFTEEKLNRQKLITRTTLETQEKEKNMLGRELHDNVSQLLATTKMYLGIMKMDEQDEQYELLVNCREYLDLAIKEIRNLSHVLVAPSAGEINLENALTKMVNELSVLKVFSIDLICNIPDHLSIDPQKQLAIYRIVQEQMNNIQKYAKCNMVTIELIARKEGIYLRIEDDGIGFDTSSRSEGIGLMNIRNRVDFYSGQTDIISSPGEGCKLEITLP